MMVGVFSWLSDPVRRRWMFARLRGNRPASTVTRVYAPEVPADLLMQCASPDFAAALGPLAAQPLVAPFELTLPGFTLTVGAGTDPFAKPPRDPGPAAALQAFVWLCRGDAPALLAAVWPAWLMHHGRVGPELAWSPGLVARRAVAVLDVALASGLPEPREQTLAVLAAHIQNLAAAVAVPGSRSSLAETVLIGHGLVRLGLDLGVPAAADLGFAVLFGEAEHVVRPSGISVLESLPHHLALTAACVDSWLAARRHRRPETVRLERLARLLLGAARALTLPGGLPMVGDVPSLVPPGDLAGLLPGSDADAGWTGRLVAAERDAVIALRDSCVPADLEDLCADGWLRQDIGGWSGLWHASPLGWPRVGALGHHDIGAGVIHYDSVPVFVDAGGNAANALDGGEGCRAAARHGGLQVGGLSPYPDDCVDYDDAFRRAVGGAGPELQSEYDGVSLRLLGFNRLGGPRETKRRWRFEGASMTLDDAINGTGRYEVVRRLLTPLAATRCEQGLMLEGRGHRFLLAADLAAVTVGGEAWPGFGVAQPITVIEYRARVNLPWRGHLALTVL